ncbi:family 20 glycosylhydrolase [Fulvivirga sp. M361]|uniref:family 20 glycosylhydrolase n=1 Tax=Fulvivirga sp. M361 TaxID=2594266 RepID=UPI00117B9C91|nr:family 20 glycosylhydrolase [Fulvivirga sp. M361]TRX61684.1 family 20 glycosylhydrolase [Fulvivirga sp. M361]
MKRYTIFLLLLLLQCKPSLSPDVKIIPKPRQYEFNQGTFEINGKTEIIASSDSLKPLAHLLARQIHKISGLKLNVTTAGQDENNILLEFNDSFKEEEYYLDVCENIKIEASNYSGLAMGTATILQLFTLSKDKIVLPRVSVYDKPDYDYRSVMLDLARFWHPVETIKETIDLLWFYKIKYLHLHLSDNRRFTFPMDDFPDLKTLNKDGSREYYTIEELKDLVEYARLRGVAIIPEIDLPGHSTQLWSKYPDVFGSIDPKTNQPVSLYVINMAKEETYQACEKIINSLAEVFYTSPYIHFGGDEVYLEAIKHIPEYQTYCKENNLDVALAGDANELFCHFINRMHTMVKSTGKQSVIWEGFHGTGAGKESIPRDITVIVWNATYNHPDSLVANGYNIVNSTWVPWYMVGAMNFAPAVEKGYQWDITQWHHWDDQFDDIEIAPNQSTLGGQISFWEQNYYKVIPVLRERVPVLSERMWNYTTEPDLEDFQQRFAQTNDLYNKLFRPISIEAEELLHNDDMTFDDIIKVKLTSSTSGKIKYMTSTDWGIPDMKEAVDYDERISIDESAIITAQLFDADGKKIGFPEQRYFRKIEPAYDYTVLGPAPTKGWKEMPDFTKLNVMREGLAGKMTTDRLEKINGELFAKVKSKGHIETRFPGIYNQYAVELSGILKIPKDGTYEWQLQTWDGLAELYIDDKLVAQGNNFKNEPESFSTSHSQGEYSFSIKYYYRQIQNQLSIVYKTAEMQDFEPFEGLVLPLNGEPYE